MATSGRRQVTPIRPPARNVVVSVPTLATLALTSETAVGKALGPPPTKVGQSPQVLLLTVKNTVVGWPDVCWPTVKPTAVAPMGTEKVPLRPVRPRMSTRSLRDTLLPLPPKLSSRMVALAVTLTVRPPVAVFCVVWTETGAQAQAAVDEVLSGPRVGPTVGASVGPGGGGLALLTFRTRLPAPVK